MKAKSMFALCLVALSSVSYVAHAEVVCETTESCRTQKMKMDTEINKRLEVLLHAKKVAPKFLNGIARNADGSIVLVNQIDAERYCKKRGLRLPTVRELAKYAQNMGAEGISEVNKAGYEYVAGRDKAGNPDNFYYNRDGYLDQKDFKEIFVWASNINTHDPFTSYAMSVSNGWISNSSRKEFVYTGSVLCVPRLL